jgi:hypothetical protein
VHFSHRVTVVAPAHTRSERAQPTDQLTLRTTAMDTTADTPFEALTKVVARERQLLEHVRAHRTKWHVHNGHEAAAQKESKAGHAASAIPGLLCDASLAWRAVGPTMELGCPCGLYRFATPASLKQPLYDVSTRLARQLAVQYPNKHRYGNNADAAVFPIADACTHSATGWTIRARKTERYRYGGLCFTEFEAEHATYGSVWGDLCTAVYATTNRAYTTFTRDHPLPTM